MEMYLEGVLVIICRVLGCQVVFNSVVMGILRKLLRGGVMQTQLCFRMINQTVMFEVDCNRLELAVKTQIGRFLKLTSRLY